MVLESLSIGVIGPLLRTGEISPTEVAEEVLSRADAYDDPAVWITRLSRDEVMRYVAEAEQRRRHGEALPLYGVPFAIKDNIDLSGTPTTCACPMYRYVPRCTSTVVDRLVRAGAVPIGKTNMDQFATGLVGTRSPYGACRNVYDPRYISGGSSSGSAVAVAGGIVSFSLGTDTAGSGRVPAALNNIVGLKPTRGVISTAGVVPACRTLDCVSVFALDCADAATVLDFVEGFDPADTYARPADDPARRRRPVIEGPFHFGVPAPDQLEFFGNSEGKRLFADAVARLIRLGGQPIEIDYSPFNQAAKLLYDGPWVAERVAAIRPFFEANPDALLPVTRRVFDTAKNWDAVRTFESLYRLQSLRAAASAQFRTIDVLLLPTAVPLCTLEQVEADPLLTNTRLGTYTNFVNLLDLAAVAVPAGFHSIGIPFGVSLIAPAGSDRTLLHLAARFHQLVRETAPSAPPPLPAHLAGK